MSISSIYDMISNNINKLNKKYLYNHLTKRI